MKTAGSQNESAAVNSLFSIVLNHRLSKWFDDHIIILLISWPVEARMERLLIEQFPF